MKKSNSAWLYLFCLLIFGYSFIACDTIPQDVPPEPPTAGTKKEDITFKWKLVAGKVTAPIAIADIYDATNPLISGNPAAVAALCTKNSFIVFNANNTFVETSDCYNAFGVVNNPQAGTYTFSDAESAITTTYNNVSTFPVLTGRKLTIKSIDKTSNPHKLTVVFKTVQSGVEVTTEFVYEKQEAFAKEEILFKWKLTAGKVTAPIAISDIFDATNPAISGNPQALAAICFKNAVLDLKANNTFSETADCYTPLGAGNNPQNGSYVFNATESSITTTYANASTFPTVLVGKKFIIKSISSSPAKIIFEYKTNQGGFDVTTEFTYEKVP